MSGWRDTSMGLRYGPGGLGHTQLHYWHWGCCSVTFLMGFLCGSGTKEPMETELMKVPMTIVDWGKCLKQFPKLTKNMLCAGYQNESYDACQVSWVSPPPYPYGPPSSWSCQRKGVLSPLGMDNKS